MKNFIYRNRVLWVSLVIGYALIAAICLSSCAGNKYGCGHGAPRQTWGKMVKRINSPY